MHTKYTNAYCWLVVGPPLWKIYESVNWDDEIPNINGKISHWWQPNHQPDWDDWRFQWYGFFQWLQLVILGQKGWPDAWRMINGQDSGTQGPISSGWGPPDCLDMWTLVYKPWNKPHELVRDISTITSHWALRQRFTRKIERRPNPVGATMRP